MKLFASNDTVASIRHAHGAYTHVIVNRGYTTIKPVFFRSGKIADLPVYLWAHWEAASAGQLARWRSGGGVLLDRGTISDGAGPADVLVFVECPLSVARIAQSMVHIAEYGVIPRPHTWIVHEQAIDLRTPEQSRLRLLWDICRGQRLTDDELAEYSGLPKQIVQYQRNSFKPVEEWEVRPRIAPEEPGLLLAWEWIGEGRSEPRKVVREAGHKTAIKELARRGHVSLKKVHRYAIEEPDWDRLEEKRLRALADLAEVRSLVESLPDHLRA
ncbi:MAG: hypothetical protein ACTHJ9_17410 [Rhodanobacter sp.]